jgi:hypothetical protein
VLIELEDKSKKLAICLTGGFFYGH